MTRTCARLVKAWWSHGPQTTGGERLLRLTVASPDEGRAVEQESGAASATAGPSSSQSQIAPASPTTSGTQQEAAVEEGRPRPEKAQRVRFEGDRDEPNDTMDDVDNAPDPTPKRPRGPPPTRVFPEPRSEEFTLGSSGCLGHRTNTQNGAKSVELSHIHDRQARTAGEVAALHSNGQQTPTTHLSDPKRISMVQVELKNDTNSKVKRTGEKVARMSEPSAKDGRVKIGRNRRSHLVSRPAQSCGYRERSIRLSHCCERYTSTVTTVSVWTMTAAWRARWCHREKGDGVRSRFLVKQFNDAKQGDFFTYTPRAESCASC